MSASGKHTVYIDVDDEITSIIEKVKAAPDKIVALVLPKRATVLQSIVNMKLLKKSATNAKKSLVLITSEAGLLPLAGVVGLHVAKSLQSKPVIPPPPERPDSTDSEINEGVPDAEPELDKTKPVGELAGLSAAEDTPEDDTETIELDNDQSVETPAGKTSKKKPRFKVPNFEKFRLSFFLAILAVILLVVGWVFAAVIMPKAIITIATDTTTVTALVPFTANVDTKDLDLEKAQLPAVLKETKKTDTEKTTATGKKDNGTKAAGTITVRNCDYSDGFTIAAGSSFTSGGKTFVSNESVTIPKFTGNSSSCTTAGGSSGKGTVAVTAQGGGESYNVASAQYSVPGIPSSAKVDAVGSAMAGGTTSIVTVVSQDDIDKATALMKGRLDQEAFKELDQLLQTEELIGLTETRVIAAPVIKSTPALNQEASGEVTVTSETTYNVLGVKKDYLSQLVKKDASAKIDTAKQSISDDGLATAVIRLVTRTSPTAAQMTVQSVVTAGPELNAATIKEQIRGKKRGDAEKIIGNLPGVKDVTVQYKPFWVLSTPKAAKKITIIVEKPASAETHDEATDNAGQ